MFSLMDNGDSSGSAGVKTSMWHSEDLSVKGLSISGEKASFLISVEIQVLRKKEKR